MCKSTNKLTTQTTVPLKRQREREREIATSSSEFKATMAAHFRRKSRAKIEPTDRCLQAASERPAEVRSLRLCHLCLCAACYTCAVTTACCHRHRCENLSPLRVQFSFRKEKLDLKRNSTWACGALNLKSSLIISVVAYYYFHNITITILNVVGLCSS